MTMRLKIRQWVSAISAIYRLTKVVPKEKATYLDVWRPWKEQEQQRQKAKEDMREESRKHMEVDVGKEDTVEADTVLKEAKHNGTTKKWSLKEKIMDAKKKAVLKMLDPPWALPPKVEVGDDEIKSTPMKLQEEFKRVVRTAM